MYLTLRSRVPYRGDAKASCGLLTTAHNDHNTWFGTLVSGNTQYHPAPYLGNRLVNPGVIWYWVNEDDCGPDRKPSTFSEIITILVHFKNQ